MRMLRLVVFGFAGVLLAAQLVPYGKNRTNPPVVQDAPWDSPEAERIAVAACYDCHSNQTDIAALRSLEARSGGGGQRE